MKPGVQDLILILPYPGKRCEPTQVKEVSEIFAPVKSCSPNKLNAATCKAAIEFFRKL